MVEAEVQCFHGVAAGVGVGGGGGGKVGEGKAGVG